MEPTTIVIKHKREKSATGRLKYLLSPKPSKRERAAVGPRVARYWGNIALTGDYVEDALRLTYGADFHGPKGKRNEVWEILFTADEALGHGCAHDVEAAVELGMAEFFPGIRWAAVRHSDREHCHIHCCLLNDSHGLALKLSDDDFRRFRQDIIVWSKGRCKSGWGRGRAAEHRLAKLSNEEILAEVRAGRLRPTHLRRDGTLRRLKWQDLWEPVEQTIAWWRLSGMLKTRAAWLELNIRLSYQVAVHKRELDAFNAAQALRLEARAAQQSAPSPSRE